MKQQHYYTHRRNEVIPFVPKTAKTLLDIGCGAGFFGENIKSTLGQVVVWGVEPVKGAAELASRRLDKVVHSRFEESAPIPNEFFDVVVFNDSLEHFADPVAALSLAKRKLASDGRLICVAPNVRYIENMKHLLIERDWKYTDEGVLDYTHLRFFTKKSLVRTVEGTGYRVVEVHGINPHEWRGWKYRCLGLVLGAWVEDMRYLQYVVVALRASDG